MSDTPRTDAAKRREYAGWDINNQESMWGIEIVAAEDMAQLERELAEATKRGNDLADTFVAIVEKLGIKEEDCDPKGLFSDTVLRYVKKITRKPEPLSAPTHDGWWWARGDVTRGIWANVYVNRHFQVYGNSSPEPINTQWISQWLPNPAPEVEG